MSRWTIFRGIPEVKVKQMQSKAKRDGGFPTSAGKRLITSRDVERVDTEDDEGDFSYLEVPHRLLQGSSR
jgi:hypothetical protein